MSNLTKYTQTLPGQVPDSVSYAYNKANQITTVTDTTGTFTYS